MRIFYFIIKPFFFFFLIVEMDGLLTKSTKDGSNAQIDILVVAGNISLIFIFSFVNYNYNNYKKATNRIDAIDPAVLRPGRFDEHVAISLPNEKVSKPNAKKNNSCATNSY
jgi:SpoVK/Ycf46/Vps4 family AAA+-type ATPase